MFISEEEFDKIIQDEKFLFLLTNWLHFTRWQRWRLYQLALGYYYAARMRARWW